MEDEVIQPASIINLSNHILTESEVNLLAKGRKFIPKPLRANEADIEKAVKDFSRRIKLSAFFSYNFGSENKKDSDRKPFTSKSGWSPPDKYIPKNVLEQLNILEKSVGKLEKTQNKNNLNLSKKNTRQ